MGASKLNIANIFNAETIIEGLISGIFAILLVYLVFGSRERHRACRIGRAQRHVAAA